MSWVGVITDAGVNLFANYASDGKTLSINSVKTGTGPVSSEGMRARTSLVAETGTGIVESKQQVTGGTMFRLNIGAAP